MIQNEGTETRDAFSRNRTGIGSYDLENDGVKVRGGSQVRQILTRPLDPSLPVSLKAAQNRRLNGFLFSS